MPPVHSKLQEATKITTLPGDSLDLFDIVTNVVTKSNSQIAYKKAKPKIKFKFPCDIRDKSVNKNQKSIYCNNCGLWVHKSCEGLTDGEFQKIVEEDESMPWSCLVCKVKSNAEIFPFCLLSKLELLDLYGIDLPSHLETLPSFETRSKLVNLRNLNDFDIAENVINAVNSKYYTGCPDKNATFFTKLKSMAFCSNAIIFLDSERV